MIKDNKKVMISYRFASSGDFREIEHLLSACGLPFADCAFDLSEYVIAVAHQSVVGCVGLETHQADGLIKSFAVRDDHRRAGLGTQLFHRIAARARQRNVEHLHLLTTTAEKFFQKLGFESLDRKKVPLSIRATHESADLSPSGVYFVKRNIARYPLFYDGNTQLLQNDLETNSLFWAIHSRHMKFTFFEVPPSALFSRHAHQSEQITYVLQGCLHFRVNENVFSVRKGDCISIPPHCEHEVYTESEGATAVDCWSRPEAPLI